MAANKQHFVYIKTNEAHNIFEIGNTTDIMGVLVSDKPCEKKRKSLLKPTQCPILIYYENCANLTCAIKRSKRIQKLPPSKRRALIERYNPGWLDLSKQWTP